MKPETIQKILALLKQDADIKKLALLRMVENSTALRGDLDDRVREYRAAYNALTDFEVWMENRDEED